MVIVPQLLDQVAPSKNSTDLLTLLFVSQSSIYSKIYYTVTIIALSDDENRIILRPIVGHSDCQRDFINACYVDVC